MAPEPVIGPQPTADQPTEEFSPLDPDHPSAGAEFQWPQRDEAWTAQPPGVGNEDRTRAIPTDEDAATGTPAGAGDEQAGANVAAGDEATAPEATNAAAGDETTRPTTRPRMRQRPTSGGARGGARRRPTTDMAAPEAEHPATDTDMPRPRRSTRRPTPDMAAPEAEPPATDTDMAAPEATRRRRRRGGRERKSCGRAGERR